MWKTRVRLRIFRANARGSAFGKTSEAKYRKGFGFLDVQNSEVGHVDIVQPDRYFKSSIRGNPLGDL